MNQQNIPEGFKLCRDDGTFNNVMSPLYLKLVDGQPVIGLMVEKHHCNYSDIAHGGFLMTLMDFALASAVCSKLGQYTTTPTINMSMDFMSAAKLGDWIQVDVVSIDMTRTLGFVTALIQGPQGHVARASGCFKLPSDAAKHPGIAAGDYHQWRTNI
jgi:uncharacterized protein (TIGR00369 family)